MRTVIVLGVLALLVVVFLLGPRVRLDLTESPAIVASDETALAAAERVAQSEQRFGDITPGAEKGVVWATPSAPARTPLAIVYLHGFSATRQETAPLTANVASEFGANVYYARLSGHGRGSDPLSAANAADWLVDTAEAYAIGTAIGEHVIVIGVSTGATLATWLALQPGTDRLAAQVLISPNFGLANGSAGVLTMPWGLLLAETLMGKSRTFEAVNDGHARYWTPTYDIRAAAEMVALVEALNAAPLESIETPTLLVRSDRDTVIDIAQADATLARFASPIAETHIVTDSDDPWGHVIAGDILSPASTDGIAAAIIAFVRNTLPAAGSADTDTAAAR